MSEARRIIHFFSHENVCMHAACSLETGTGARVQGLPSPTLTNRAVARTSSVLGRVAGL